MAAILDRFAWHPIQRFSCNLIKILEIFCLSRDPSKVSIYYIPCCVTCIIDITDIWRI